MADTPLTPVRGTLELLILRTLREGSELHGFFILDWIRQSTDGALVVEDGALYHALHRMERRGWIGSDWGVSEKGRRARYYRITAKGKRVLAAEEERWRRYVNAVSRIPSCEEEGSRPCGASTDRVRSEPSTGRSSTTWPNRRTV